MHAIYIRATHGQIWSALTESSQTRRYFDFMVGFLAVVSDWQIGSPVQYRTADGQAQIEGRILKLQAPRNLVTIFSALYDEQVQAEQIPRATNFVSFLPDASFEDARPARPCSGCRMLQYGRMRSDRH